MWKSWSTPWITKLLYATSRTLYFFIWEKISTKETKIIDKKLNSTPYYPKQEIFSFGPQIEIQLLSRVFCYSWLVYLLFLWWRGSSLNKVGNPISDGIVFVFHLAWCVRGFKSLKRFWPYLIIFSASRMVSLSNYCIWCLFFISNFMKSSTVYAASLCTFVRFETMIWPSSRFDITLKNFKKPLDIFSRKKTFRRVFS